MEKLDDFKISSENLSLIFDTDFIEQAMSKGQGVVQAALGITDKMLQRYYKVGLQLLEERKWEDACDVFTFLTFLNATIYNFWLGLGIAEQSRANFDRALIAYVMAEAADSENPVPSANAFQCSLALGDKESAELCWQKANEKCADKPEWAELQKKLTELHSQMK